MSQPKLDILDYNVCGLDCDCGANIKIGGSREAMEALVKFLKGGSFDCTDKTNYTKKISNNKF